MTGGHWSGEADARAIQQWILDAVNAAVGNVERQGRLDHVLVAWQAASNDARASDAVATGQFSKARTLYHGKGKDGQRPLNDALTGELERILKIPKEPKR